MKILICKDYGELSHTTAQFIAGKINSFKPSPARPFVLGLPTGSSSLGIYAGLIDLYKSGFVSFLDVVTFNMDEYVGLPEDHPESYHRFMYRNFFDHIDIEPHNINLPNGNAPDLETECRRYEEKIKACGGINLFLGGIGTNGHMAFNEPGSPFDSVTRVVTLAPETLDANSRFFGGDINKVPKTAISVGIKTILQAAEVVLVASGAKKAEALQRVVEAEADVQCPASALRLHPNVMIVCDEEAAQKLKPETINGIKDL